MPMEEIEKLLQEEEERKKQLQHHDTSSEEEKMNKIEEEWVSSKKLFLVSDSPFRNLNRCEKSKILVQTSIHLLWSTF
jgi:hypothetical protein